jgi:GNAT superfamily N-acetyltransferase
MTPLSDARPIAYFKRFRMEINLGSLPPLGALPPGYTFIPWQESLLDAHAEVMFCSFHEEIDATVFPSLSDMHGSSCLMKEIRRKSGFMPEATWLLTSLDGPCGSVQGIRERTGLGAIQNIGITLPHRGRGLGTTLLLQALHNFRRAGLAAVFLEVTAQNEGAVRLYRRIGFRRRKTLYKAVETGARPAPAAYTV